MRYETVTVQECLNMYHIKGKRTILHNGKVLGFQKEKADKLGKDFERWQLSTPRQRVQSSRSKLKC